MQYIASSDSDDDHEEDAEKGDDSDDDDGTDSAKRNKSSRYSCLLKDVSLTMIDDYQSQIPQFPT
jgi:hypothetical protein